MKSDLETRVEVLEKKAYAHLELEKKFIGLSYIRIGTEIVCNSAETTLIPYNFSED